MAAAAPRLPFGSKTHGKGQAPSCGQDRCGQAAAGPHSGKVIAIRGAREHNLKNIDIDLPRDSLIVMTGLSGSGKSSLAFDTIYAEGQRRYVESLSAYARQFLEMMQKPDVDQIDGLSPAISIEQKTTSRNPRSTVGTVTEIYDYMRLLFARVGIPYSPATGLPIESQTVSQMVDRILALPEGTRLYLLAPVVRGRKGEYRKDLAEFMKKGFQRAKIDGTFLEIAEAPALDKKLKHDIDIVVDRVVVRADISARLANSLETALKIADGIAIAELADKPLPRGATAGEHVNKSKNETHERIVFSEKFACPVSGFTISEIEPRLFSFNNPFGACPECDGLGTKQAIDPDLVDPRRERDAEGRRHRAMVEDLLALFPADARRPRPRLQIQADRPLVRPLRQGARRDPPRHRRSRRSPSSMTTGCAPTRRTKVFEGVIPNLERRWKETDSAWVREEIGRYFSAQPCEVCHGARLKPEALAVKLAGLNISQVAEKSIRAAGQWFAELPDDADRSSRTRSPAAS